MSDFIIGKAESQKMLKDMNMNNILSGKETAKIIKDRRKSMTIEELKAILKNMPDEALVSADESNIKKITAELGKDGNIICVNLEI